MQFKNIKNAHLVEKDIQMTMHRELEPHGKSADDKEYYRTQDTLRRDGDNLTRVANVLSCTHAEH